MGALFDPASLIDLLLPVVMTLSLIMGRIAGLFVSSPFFSATQIPAQVKALTLMLISLLLIGPVGIRTDLHELMLIQYIGLTVYELSIGIIIGLILTLIYSGIEMAGRLFGIQMGFAVANVVDPTTSEQIGILSQMIRFIFLFIFFAIDGHLLLLQALISSFKILPLGGGELNFIAISDNIIELGAQIFQIAIQIALPISCTVLLINTGLAALARTNPQMNIFMIGFMLNIGAGLLVLSITIPTFIPYFQRLIYDCFVVIGTVLREL